MHGHAPARQESPDRAVAELAARQHGVVTRAQLASLGLGRGAIEHRLAIGRLYLIHRGVYTVGHPELTHEGRWMAGVLSAGRGAVLSHRSAAALWDLPSPSLKFVEVTTPVTRSPGTGILAHESLLARQEVTQHEGIPVTTVPRTLLDLAAVVSGPVLSRAFREAQVRRSATPGDVAALLDRHPGRRGNMAVRALLADARFGTGRTRSELEAAFTRFLRHCSLPAPRRNVHMQVGGIELEADCIWPGARLIVELDGRAFHDTASAFEHDRSRDRALAANGWTVIRVTWRQLHRDEAQLARDLRTLLQRTAA
jgi:very-short-patch-repair endonuclease